jgi:CheY-like chemotaxis protein
MTAYLVDSQPMSRARHMRNVLCVDADDESRLLIAEVLYEHDVDFALTADDAVQLAHSRSYALCFIDPDVVRRNRRNSRVPQVQRARADRDLCHIRLAAVSGPARNNPAKAPVSRGDSCRCDTDASS